MCPFHTFIRSRAAFFVPALAAAAGFALADQPVMIFDPLPAPLVLPPGNVETLPLNHRASFYGDAIRVVDCSAIVPAAFPGDTPDGEAVYGTCGNQFFGGDLLMSSHLSGNLRIQFTPTNSTTAHFIVSQGVMPGDDAILSGPLEYRLPIRDSVLSDALILSSGDVDLISGYATNIQWNVSATNSGFQALGNLNPNLAAPVIAYPGQRGHAWARFTQRRDGLLDLYFRGSTFLPLGSDAHGEMIRLPLDFCSADRCASIPARGASLHPYLELDTEDSLALAPCAPACPDIPQNTVEVFTVNARYTAFGDDLDLLIPELGGPAPGRAEMQGRIEIQFGSEQGGTVPFRISALPPEGLFADPPNSPLLGSGFRGFLMAANQTLYFPLVTYPQHKIYIVDEPFNFAQGMIDLASGQVLGEFEYPIYIDQSLLEQLIPDNDGRVSTDPFFLMAMRPPQDSADPNYAFFEKEPNGQTMFRANLFHHRSFATYCFPEPDLIAGQCWVTPPGGSLNIYVKLQAARLPDPANPGNAVLSDARTVTSSVGDVFSYNFSVPCAPGAALPFSFVYTNDNSGASGGTFTMTHLASVSCTNSKVSAAAPGSYDQIAVTGFGNWSQDPQDAQPRFLAASISVALTDPWASIIVFQRYPGEALTLPGAFIVTGDETDVNLSTAENKPPTKPVP